MLIHISLIFFIILILVIIIYSIKKGKNHILSKILDKITLISAVFVPISIYLTYKVFALQLDNMTRDSTYKLIDRSWLDVNNKIIEYYDECPNFVESLYYDWQKHKNNLKIEDNKIGDKQDKWYAVNYLSIIIFQAWEDFLTSAGVDETGMSVWINNFLQWAHSKTLKQKWNVLRTNYAKTTQDFGDLMFYIASTNIPENFTEMEILSKMVSESRELKDIINNRNSIDITF